MDTFTLIVAFVTLGFIYFGEKFRTGAYLWIAIHFAVILALRMAEPFFYVSTAGVIAVLAYRAFSEREDVRTDTNPGDS